MNALPQDGWFYTSEGERIGPVSLAELRVKVQECTLNPRLDMVWTHGMVEWKPAGQIEGLFEKLPAGMSQESLAQAVESYPPPQHELVEEMMSQEGEWPGARRRSFLIATILFPVVWSFCLPMGTGFLTKQVGPEITGVIGIGAAFLPLLVGIYFSLMRLVNLGMSRWWFLANFVPILNLWVGFRCFACPAGYVYHKKLGGAGVVLALFYWLFVGLGILAIAATVALLLGSFGDTELQEQCREALRIVLEQTGKP
jgi:hypothetical protein